MRFPPSFLDEIRERVPISEVVGARVRFDSKKSNAARGDYWACCPFHGEKTPSFHCEDAKGRYHCFGCGVSGDIFRFVTEMDNLSFFEAVEMLADKAGLAMPKPDPHYAQKEDLRASLHEVMEQAAQFFEHNLQEPDTQEAEFARTYLYNRGMHTATQKHFRLGYAPTQGRALKDHLLQKNIDIAMLKRTGLFVFPDDGSAPYDRFRDRVIFPILDLKNRVIAFGGRALKENARAKYLNSPETELFHKGKIVYNLLNARQAMRQRSPEAGINSVADKPLLVVEGYMDVVALTQAGVSSVVAPLGTALTQEQINLLWRYAPQPVLCFDGDKAGVQAAYRAMDRALPLLKTGFSLNFVLMPEGQDPDDFVRNNGKEQLEETLKSALPLVDMLWQRETKNKEFTTPESRASLEKSLKNIIHTITDTGLRYYYLQDIKQRLWKFFHPVRQKKQYRHNGQNSRNGYNKSFNQGLVTSSLASSSFVKSVQNKQAFSTREAAILRLVVAYPALSYEDFEDFTQLEFQNTELKQLHNSMITILSEEDMVRDGGDKSAILQQRLEEQGQKTTLDKIIVLTNGLGVKIDPASGALNEAREFLKQALTLYRRAHSLNKQIKEIEADLINNATSEDFARLLALREELRQTKDLEAAFEEN